MDGQTHLTMLQIKNRAGDYAKTNRYAIRTFVYAPLMPMRIINIGRKYVRVMSAGGRIERLTIDMIHEVY